MFAAVLERQDRERVLLERRADDLQRSVLLGDRGADRGGVAERDLDRAAEQLGDAGVGARDAVDRVEAGLVVVAVLVGVELAGELLVLDPGVLDADLAVRRRRRRRRSRRARQLRRRRSRAEDEGGCCRCRLRARAKRRGRAARVLCDAIGVALPGWMLIARRYYLARFALGPRVFRRCEALRARNARRRSPQGAESRAESRTDALVASHQAPHAVARERLLVRRGRRARARWRCRSPAATGL